MSEQKYPEFAHLLACCPKDMQLGKCPKGFTLEMIEISSDGITATHKTDILAFTHKGLAIHHLPWGWYITHITSGKKLFGANTKREAVKAVKTLGKAFDWHLPEATLRHRKGCKEAVRAVCDA